jgi:hypothetical protein
MNTNKLKEALAELHHQRAVINTAISNLQSIITLMSGEPQELAEPDAKVKRTSYVDDVIEILEASGKPLHIKDIAKSISERRGKEVARASVEASVIRYIASSGSSTKIVKISPGYFGLPTWKSLLPLQNQAESAA